MKSTGSMSQLTAFQQLNNTIRLDKTMVDSVNFMFGIRKTSAIRTIYLKTQMDLVTFYIVKAAIPFLLSLANIDRMSVYFNNVKNTLIQENKYY